MRPVKIVTDSCSDLPKELREKYDIDYMMMNTVKDGKETPASLDWEFYSPKELYDVMRGGERYTTTMVPPAEFQKYFRAELEKGNDIVYIACSGKLSGSVNVGKVEAENILKGYPGATICCVDSLNACLGEGLIAIKAAQFRDQGKSAQGDRGGYHAYPQQRQPVCYRSQPQRAEGGRTRYRFFRVLRQFAGREADHHFRQGRQ